MKILIDADGCPVTHETIELGSKYNVDVVIYCDTSHEFKSAKAQIITVSKGADSVDFALANGVSKGDIVVTQDYGLAAMVMSKGAVPINQDGMIYTNENIDALLLSRHTSQKIRRAGGKTKGPRKRSTAQTEAFCSVLESVLKELKD